MNIPLLSRHAYRLCRNKNILEAVAGIKFHSTDDSKTSYVDVTKTEGVIVGSKTLRKKLQHHVGARQFWLENLDVLSKINAKRASKQEDLITRKMKDSVQEVIIPLGSNPAEHDKYLNFYGTVRFGKLLEDMDTLAGWVGFKYFKGPSERAPFSLVTACVDKIDLKESLVESNKDIKLKGFVSWAGKTSLEVTIHIDQQSKDGWKRLAEAVFVMVARSLKDGTAAVVNKIEAVDVEEKHYYERGKVNKALRQKKLKESLFKMAPTAKERDVIHNMFLATLDPNKSTFHSRVKPKDTVWMEETQLKNIIICHPQSRNLYNKIFGGFLMREAFELAWATATVFIKSRPTVISMDDITFRKPVEVGSLLYLSSQIVFTKGKYLQTRVHAEVLDPKTGHVDTTNIFHFHFTSENDIKHVMPMSYGEYILYLDGRRHCPRHILDGGS